MCGVRSGNNARFRVDIQRRIFTYHPKRRSSFIVHFYISDIKRILDRIHNGFRYHATFLHSLQNMIACALNSNPINF